ncbi:hypothetical protein Q8F55_002672 [Vanrija albida]|uniref:Wings apart-like protein C-terminal domain-containing protein n=1 Tax=Vanrija albida TaxID=181172 RepID=A0ABR3QBG1_9TREE
MPVSKKEAPVANMKRYDAAHKAIREHFEKVKSQGYKDKQALLARGRTAFVKLVSSKVPTDSDVKPFCNWVEEELVPLKDDVPRALYLGYCYAALETVSSELVTTLAESVPAPSQGSARPQSPEAALVSCGVLIAALIESVKVRPKKPAASTVSGPLRSALIVGTAKELHTDTWLKLLVNLLRLFEGGRLGGTDAASSVSDLLQEIATDVDNPQGRTLLAKDNGSATLGKLLHDSAFSALSVNLIRAISPMMPAPGRRRTFMDKAFGDQQWSPETVERLKDVLADVKVNVQTNKVPPNICKKVVNAISAKEDSHSPKGFTLSKFIFDGDDKLDNDKCKRRLGRGDIIVYFDSFVLLVKSYTDEGAEDDFSFGVEGIKSFKRATRGVDGASDFTFQAGGETNVTLGMTDAEADAFEAATSQLRRTPPQPTHHAPSSVENESSLEATGVYPCLNDIDGGTGATELGFVDAAAHMAYREELQNPPATAEESSVETPNDEKNNESPSSPASTLKRPPRPTPKSSAGAKGKSTSAVLQPRKAGPSRSFKPVGESPATSATSRPSRAPAAKASERLAALALDNDNDNNNVDQTTASGGSPPPHGLPPPAAQGEEEEDADERLRPPSHDKEAEPHLPDTENEKGSKKRKSWADLASPEASKLLFEDIGILEQPPQDIPQRAQALPNEVETPTPVLPPRALKSALVQSSGQRTINDPSHKPTPHLLKGRPGAQAPAQLGTGPSHPATAVIASSVKGKKSVKIGERVQVAPRFYPTPIRTPAQEDATWEHPPGSDGPAPNHEVPITPMAEGSRDVTGDQLLDGLGLGLQQLSAAGIGTPGASMQHAIIFSAAPPALNTQAPTGSVRRNSSGSERSSKRARYLSPSLQGERAALHSTLQEMSQVIASTVIKRLDAPSRKKWSSETYTSVTEISTADAAYQGVLGKLGDATRLIKEGAEPRHAKVIERMGAATAGTSIPASLFSEL